MKFKVGDKVWTKSCYSHDISIPGIIKRTNLDGSHVEITFKDGERLALFFLPHELTLVDESKKIVSDALKVKIKKLHPDAVIPKAQKVGDAGLDLTAISVEKVQSENLMIYDTGLAIEIPPGHYGQIVPRSSSYKTGQRLKNGIGIIDSNYRGPIKFMYTEPEQYKEAFKPGDRIGQLIVLPYPSVEFEEVEELSESNRGEQGFGSSGK